ncbi:hypothetical protein ILUMI_15785 [Ignelater luminosus]|uniref:RNA-directed DNA polymerase n=1 Tax=Ignelater luminosus TaxID=2038154 RepID=A0A8K0CTG8_IGNLU|nr:hypothetical protein ILUMI_15785 [Ignelater luminosus]
MLRNNDIYLAIPRIACGLDKLNWEIVTEMIRFIFVDTKIKIFIYTLNQNYPSANIINAPDLPFTPIWDKDVIKSEQEKDPFCISIREQLQTETDPFGYFIDNDGLLYKIDNSENDLLVVPKTFIRKVLHDFHNLPLAGHQGQAKTLLFVKSRFYWPNMKNDIIKYVSECQSCSQRKTSPHLKQAPIQTFPEIFYPFERTSMDITGPFVTSNNGNKYLLTFQDHFSKYVEIIPLSDQKAETVAKEFVTKIVARHGASKQLITDQGTNFVSKLFKHVCSFLGIDKIQTTPYYPTSNGMIERSYKVFKDFLSHYVADNQRDWDEWIPYLQMACCMNIHSSTGYRPYFLIHGRDPVLPIDNILQSTRVKTYIIYFIIY